VQRGVGGQRIVALRHGLLGAPDVPHSWSEVVRGVLPGETVLESALGDHRGGTQVRQHLGDRPLRRVRAAGQLLLSQRSRQVAQAVDGGPQDVDPRLSSSAVGPGLAADSRLGGVMPQTLPVDGE
jgi:hypothetical protein